MPLDILGVTKPEKPDYVLGISGFSLDPHPENSNKRVTYISSTLSSPVLRYYYQVGFTNFYHYLKRKLKKLEEIESMSLRANDAPLKLKDRYVWREYVERGLLQSLASKGQRVWLLLQVPYEEVENKEAEVREPKKTPPPLGELARWRSSHPLPFVPAHIT
ncbi:hypothetical protein BDD12DRAFT_983650 [Trichophaea hybrida]|nr:hypothetical protein BDD12DRAFT_983650 [Trichophaea hybrida]